MPTAVFPHAPLAARGGAAMGALVCATFAEGIGLMSSGADSFGGGGRLEQPTATAKTTRTNLMSDSIDPVFDVEVDAATSQRCNS